MAEKQETDHPLDKQNAIERDIQLKGALDPDNFKMPDGRTLTEVRTSNQEKQDNEYQQELQMIARRTREQSITEFSKTGDKLVMTSPGNIIDVSEPVPSEETITLAESRTTMAEIEAGVIQPLRERGDIPALSGDGPSPSTTAPGASAPTAPPTVSTPGNTSPSTSGK